MGLARKDKSPQPQSIALPTTMKLEIANFPKREESTIVFGESMTPRNEVEEAADELDWFDRKHTNTNDAGDSSDSDVEAEAQADDRDDDGQS